MGRRSRGWRHWDVLVPETLAEASREAVRRGYYVTVAELVRGAVRRELVRIGLLTEESGGGGGER